MKTLLALVYFAPSEVDLKYCLLAVDLFTSKIMFPLKNRLLLKRKQFYNYLELKRKNLDTAMRIQTDREFNQNEV